MRSLTFLYQVNILVDVNQYRQSKVGCRQLFEGAEVDPVAEALATAKRGGRSAFKLNSVGSQFRKQLHGLMAALNQCQPHYIR